MTYAICMIVTHAIISRLVVFSMAEIVKEAMKAEIMMIAMKAETWAKVIVSPMMIVMATCLSVTMVSVTLVKSAITVLMASMVLVELAEMAIHCTKAHAEPMAIPTVHLCALSSGLVMDGAIMELFIM